jgi:TonB-linked SusC/RagA family outer membrane protein
MVFYKYIHNWQRHFAAIGCLCAAVLPAQAQTEAPADSTAQVCTVGMGYYAQPARSITGAVETVRGTGLESSPVAELSLTFPGRFLGMNSIEQNSEPGSASTLKLIRGISTVNGTTPLVIIDGMITPTEYWDYLVPQEIETVTILKDGASTAIYGMQGAGGAIIITTKRGHDGERRIDVHADWAFQQMTKRPKLLGSAAYVALRNQAATNDGKPVEFNPTQVAGFTSGDRSLWPDNNWYEQFMRDYSVMQRAGVNVSGSAKGIRYFTSLNYMHQGSLFNVDNNVAGRDYDPTPGTHSLGFRSNIDVSFSKRLSGFLRINGNVDWEKMAGSTNSSIYNLLFLLPPTMYGPTTPDGEVVTTSEASSTSSVVPYGQLNRSGYEQDLVTNITSQAGLKLDMDFVTPGLTLTGMMAYQSRSNQSTISSQTYASYTQDALGSLNFTQFGTVENSPLSAAPLKYSTFEYNLNLSAQFDYERRFGTDHYLKALAYGFYMQQEKPESFYIYSNDVKTAGNVLPYYRQNFGASVLYGYRNRYFLKADVGYTGSEQFAKGNRYVLTPGISAAWVASEESFLKDNPLVTYLKLRASYGVNANDQFGTTRFMYLDYYDAAGNEGLKGNPDLKPETIRKQNYGFDLRLRDEWTLRFDYFSHRTDNMLISGAGIAPDFSGIASTNYPKLNTGAMENHGYEVSLTYNKEVYKDLQLTAGLGLSYNKNKVISAGETPYGEGYKYQHRTEGYSIGQTWGYLIDRSNGNGYINNATELEQAKKMYKFGTAPRLGDFLFQDISGDGYVDDKDFAPLRYSQIPEYFYNFTLGLKYKSIELNALFQGTAHSSCYLYGVGVDESIYPYIYTDLHQNAWTRERYTNSEAITHPALSTGQSSSSYINESLVVDNSYLRLRNLEIAYTLPASVSKLISAGSIRVAFNAQNLLTFDNMPTKYIDPEIRSLSAFQPFRVYNMVLNIKF